MAVDKIRMRLNMFRLKKKKCENHYEGYKNSGV